MHAGCRSLALLAAVVGAFVAPVGGQAVGRACAASELHVAVVVDPGTGSGVSAVCIPAASTDNGATVLAARARLLGTPQPRYNAAGLLCAIDGVPATGCGTRTTGHYAYWSYWHAANGQWSYASIGPAASRVDVDVVEGWRFQPDGTGLPTDPPPRGPATASAVCAPSPPTSSLPSSPATVPRATPGPRETAATTPTTAPAIAPQPIASGPVVSVGSARATSSVPREPSQTRSQLDPVHPEPPTTRALASPSTVAVSARGLASAPRARGSGGAPLGLIAGLLIVLGLSAAGAVAARRRRPAR